MRRIGISLILLAAIAVFICQGCGKIEGAGFPYIASPRAVVHTPASPAEGSITVTFQLIDRERELGMVVLEYSTDNGQTFTPCTLVDPAEATGLDSVWYPGKTHAVQWNSVADSLALSGDVSVCVKVTPSDASNPAGAAGVSGYFTANNIAYNQPPGATAATPAGVQFGNIPVNYFLADVESDTCSIAVQYSTDDGVNWNTATMGSASEGLTGLSSSPGGTAHMFLWDSRSDGVAPSGQVDTVRVRITPADFHVGTVSETNSFSVDNTITNDPPTVTITDGPADGSIITTNQATFTWSGSDTDGTVIGYYCSFDHDPPDVWTTNTSVTSGVLSEGSHTFRVVALDDQYDISSVAARSFTVSTPSGTEIYVDGSSGSDSNDGRSWPTAVKTIQTGLDKAEDGWEVFVADGTYTGAGNSNLDFTGKAIHLKAVGGAANCIIDCKNSSRGFHFHSGETNSAVVEGFTIRNGRLVDNYGAGILCKDSSSPTILKCRIENCHVESGIGIVFGGGIACMYDSSPVISECIISTCSAIHWGGGISCWDEGTPLVIDCTITCSSAESGGGVCSHGAEATISNCTISSNHADNGGGVYFWSVPSELAGTTVIANHALSCGGGVYCDAMMDPSTITDCTISDNTSDYGGGIFCDLAGAVITGCTIANNSSKSGAGIYYYKETCTLNCTITNNSANCYGGGIFCSLALNSTISDCLISENSATTGGGGVYFGSASDVILASCVIQKNSSDTGAGIHIFASSPVIVDTTIINNTGGSYAGGLYIEGSDVELTRCIISDNSAPSSAGALCYQDADSIFVNCIISDNQAIGAASTAGGIGCDVGSSPKLINCVVTNNTAAYGGGFLCSRASYPVLENSILWGNVATISGNQFYGGTGLSGAKFYYSDYGTSPGDIGGYTDYVEDPDNTCIHLDPLFVNASTQDYHLQTGSPCINAGDNSLVPPDVTTDLDGNPRIVNGTVDIGVYEKQ